MVDSVTKVYSAVADADNANAAALQQLQNQVIALNQHYMTQAAQAEQTKTAAEGAANAQLAQNCQSPLPQMPVAPVSREYVGPSAAPVNFDDMRLAEYSGTSFDKRKKQDAPKAVRICRKRRRPPHPARSHLCL